ncbi:MAG: amidohydrolase family protein [Opitutales bacterium]
MPADVITLARVLNPISDTRCDCFADGALAWNRPTPERPSHILAVGSAADVQKAHASAATQIQDHRAQLLLPGLFDTHFHWVQDHVRDAPKTSLLEWLDTYTFPQEARFADTDYARAEAEVFWKRILAVGTIGGCCYSSVHAEAAAIALEHARGHFRIGNALMSMHCPDSLRQDPDALLQGVHRLQERFGTRYIVSPRFAPTTHPELMREAAALAQANQGWIQTHMDETPQEIAWVLGIYQQMPGFEDVGTYAEIYERCGLLGPRTLMGHCIHLEDSEWALLRATDTAITHCPTSNAPIDQRGLGSGLFDFRRADAENIRWALASDIGGGPYLSMFDVMRSFVSQNRDAGRTEATWTRALYRATQAGAELAGFGAQAGNLEPGKEASFILIPDKTPKTEIVDVESILQELVTFSEDTRNTLDSIIDQTVYNGEPLFCSA